MVRAVTHAVKLLLIVPHPDDEVYGAAGTIMQHTDAGHEVAVVTLTRGEKGRTLGLADSPEELAKLRAVELRACLDELGVQHHEQHAFPDGGLKDVPVEELARVARAAIMTYRPQTVLTFPPNGSNGHPDHVATAAAVRLAYRNLTDAPELWYYAGPTPPENEILRDQYLAPNIDRDVRGYITRKLRAIACHRSQALSTVDFIRKFPERITNETFHAPSLPLA